MSARQAAGCARLVVLVALAGATALAGCGDAAPAPPTRSPSLTVLRVTVGGADRAADVATAFATGGGRALTVAHAVGGARAVWVAEPGQRARRARVLGTDEDLDLALLSVPGLRAPALRTAPPRAGQRATVLVLRGERRRPLPAAVRRVITARVRAAPDAVVHVRPGLELDAAVMQGDSGSPVLDPAGRVIGMVFAQSASREDRTYALATKRVISAALGRLAGPPSR